MIVFLNGQFVPEAQATVSVFDRSFLYGDGLFETLRCYGGIPFRWSQHMDRLQAGAHHLGIRLPFTADELRAHAQRLLEENKLQDALLRITLSRGTGQRGYSTKGAENPLLVMTCHPAPVIDPQHPPQWRLITSSIRVPAKEPLAWHKTANKLPHIMARAEAEARGANEALLLNTNGEIAEAASSNLFWIEEDTVCTTPLASGILAGVTRATVLEICTEQKITVEEKAIQPAALLNATSAFLTLSSFEIIPVVSLDNHAFSLSPIIAQLQHHYHALVGQETITQTPGWLKNQA